jgi:hypothetical protein
MVVVIFGYNFYKFKKMINIMLKNILKLEGAQKLSKIEQKEINGGKPVWNGSCYCYFNGPPFNSTDGKCDYANNC